MTIRAHRFVAAGALAFAAVAAPLAVAFTSVAGQAVAGPACLSSFSMNGSDPVCTGYSNGNGINLGTPGGIYGPNNGQPGGYNGGVIAGPLLPGQTWRSP